MAFYPRLGHPCTRIHEILIDEVGREDLQPICEPVREGLRDEQPRERPDFVVHHLDHRIFGLGRHGVLHPVEVLPRGRRRLLAQVLHVAVELGLRQVGVDPVVPEVTCAPQRAPGGGRRRVPRLPHAYDSLGQHLGHRLAEHSVVMVYQQVAELLHEVLVELRRVFVAVLGADLEDDDLRLGLGEEALDAVEDDVDAVRPEDAVADVSSLLNAHVEDAGAEDELVVDGAGLALREGAGDQRDADVVGGGVVGAGPDDLVDPEPVGAELRHPGLAVGRVEVRAREVIAGGSEEVSESLLLGADVLAVVNKVGDVLAVVEDFGDVEVHGGDGGRGRWKEARTTI
ncbi:unnamed protein product [Musa banksii]